MIRKWIYKLRYILIIGSALLGLLGASGTFGFQYTGDNNNGGGYTYLVLDNNESGNFDGTFVNRGTENLVEFTNNGNGNWDFMYNADNYTNIWRLNSNNAGYYYGLQTYYFFSDNKLYFHKAGLANGNTVEVNNFKLFEGTGGLADYNNFTDNNSGYTYSLSDVVSEIGNVDSIIYGVYTNDRQGVFNNSRDILCFGSNNFYYCSSCIASDYNTNPFCIGGNSSIVNLGLDVNSTILDIFPLVSDSPFVGGGGGGSSSIFPAPSSYYYGYLKNRYGRVENDCKVGTNLTAMWGDSVNFEYGSGADIFELYDSLYGTGSGTDYIVKVGTWINGRLLNYNYWFNGSNNCYQYYSGGQIYSDCSYTNFPFAGQKTAIYFMTDLLNSKGVNSDGNLGYEFAVFCDYALHGENASPIKEGSALLSNINNYYNYEQLLLGDGPSMDFEKFFGTGDGYNDWEEENYDLNLDKLMDKFTSFTDMFTDYFIRPFNGEPILPRYIIVALILILLFRLFLK